MNSDLPPYARPGPSSSKNESRPSTNSEEEIQFSPYNYEINPEPSTSSAHLTYPVPMSPWSDGQSFPPFMAMAVNSAQHSSYMYPSTSGLRLPPADQIPPNCLDWTINPVKPPPRQFKTSSDPIFALGYSSSISENWMEGDKGLQYSIKNFIFSTKRTTNVNESSTSCQVHEYDSLLVSIPQVCRFLIFVIQVVFV